MADNDRLFTRPHLVIILLAAMGVAGGAIGVYTGLHRDVAGNSRAIEDFKDDLDKLMTREAEWQAQQRMSDAQLRGVIADNDREMRAGMRILAEKMIEAGKKD